MRRINQAGQSLVEFALIGSLLIAFVLGTVDFGMAYYAKVQIKNAVAEGGYYAAQHPGDDTGIKSAIKSNVSSLGLTDSNITITRNTDCSKVTISTTYEHAFLFGITTGSPKITLNNSTVVAQTVPKTSTTIGGC